MTLSNPITAPLPTVNCYPHLPTASQMHLGNPSVLSSGAWKLCACRLISHSIACALCTLHTQEVTQAGLRLRPACREPRHSITSTPCIIAASYNLACCALYVCRRWRNAGTNEEDLIAAVGVVCRTLHHSAVVGLAVGCVAAVAGAGGASLA